MITLEEDALQTTDVFPPDWPGVTSNSVVALDSALLATLSSRIHCRTPMKRLDREELPGAESLRTEGWRTRIRPEKNPAPEEVTTYRCMCGFTMDTPSIALGYAAAS